MPKNPFVNCKSRKQKKKKVVVNQEPRAYCPRSMVRYDNTQTGYNTVFVCKMCKTCVLSETALASHIIRCKEAFEKKTEPTEPVKKVEEPPYICEICNTVFSRKAKLNKHLEDHSTAPSDLEFEESDE